MALRLRLNEAVDELDKLKLSHAALEVRRASSNSLRAVAAADILSVRAHPQVKSQQAERDLVVAKADRLCPETLPRLQVEKLLTRPLSSLAPVNLVNKDQIDILHSLRASVNEDKAGLDAELRDLKERLKEMGQKERMHVDQINRCAAPALRALGWASTDRPATPARQPPRRQGRHAGQHHRQARGPARARARVRRPARLARGQGHP